MIPALKQRLIKHKEFRYAVSGVLSEIVEYGSFFLLISVTDLLVVSNSISFILGIVSGFFLHKLWSFAGDQKMKAHYQVITYGVVATCNFFLTNILISWLVHGLELKPMIAKLITMGLSACWTYIVLNTIIFRRVV